MTPIEKKVAELLRAYYNAHADTHDRWVMWDLPSSVRHAILALEEELLRERDSQPRDQ